MRRHLGRGFLKKSMCLTFCTSMAAIITLTACSTDTGSPDQTSAGDTETTVDDTQQPVTQTDDFAPKPQYYEAEKATLLGNTKTATTVSGFSGDGYVEGFNDDGDGVTFSITIEQTGFYDLNFRTASAGGEKTNVVYVDGEKTADVSIADVKTFQDSICRRVYLTEGTHEISYMKSWGWVYLDTLAVTGADPLPEDLYDVSAKLVNPNADDNAKRLMSYMTDIYGKSILSGQYSDSMYGTEFQAIKLATGGIADGKTPAVLGLDMMEYTPSRVENGSVGSSVDSAIEFWNAGGIVTYCWHWNAPSKYLTGQWYSGFYKEYTNINLASIMNGEDEEGYQLLLDDIDAIAKQLQKLEDAGVPILWRPLHEAAGGWFWWGASGADAYKELYILLYDKLTNEYGLDNLIWVWNGQDAQWYPGDEYCDIVGMDIYAGEQIYSSQISSFLETRDMAKGHKMVIMSENGCIPDPELEVRDDAMWGMWCTWGGEFVTVGSGINRLSDTYTEESMVVKAYESEHVITLDELPDLKTYEIKE